MVPKSPPAQGRATLHPSRHALALVGNGGNTGIKPYRSTALPQQECSKSLGPSKQVQRNLVWSGELRTGSLPLECPLLVLNSLGWSWPKADIQSVPETAPDLLGKIVPYL